MAKFPAKPLLHTFRKVYEETTGALLDFLRRKRTDDD